MKAPEWHGLQRGDAVFVHPPGSTGKAAEAGVVRFVEMGADGEANSVGIRLQRSEYVVVWPKVDTVHRDACAPVGTCWRCDGIAPMSDRVTAPARPNEKAEHDA